MKHITAKGDMEVPHNEEYKFKDRAQALVNKWHALGSTGVGEVNGMKEDGKPESEHKENGIVNGDAVPPTTSTDAVEEQIKDDVPKEADDAGDLTMDGTIGDITMSEAA